MRHLEKGYDFVSAIRYGFLAAALALAAPAFAAGDAGGGSGDQTPNVGAGGGAGAMGGGAAGGAGAAPRPKNQSGLTTCQPGMVWDKKQHKCLVRHGGVVPDPELTEYAFALAKADRYQEAIDVLDLLDNPNTPRALNYRGYATRKLGRTDEGIGYYLKSVELDPNYPQVREYLGEAYIVEGKYDFAKDQLAAIEKLCGSGCVYYEDLAKALAQAHAL
jgi:tetratricopeptide (TPR) repeat protein